MQKKIERKTEKYSQKSDTRSDLDCLFPGNGARKRGLLTVYIRIKVHMDLQVEKSPVVVTSRDVVIYDVTLTSLKTPEWSQLVFCDDFVMILFWSIWWRHICSSVTKLVFQS
jgi:hypothetical protein